MTTQPAAHISTSLIRTTPATSEEASFVELPPAIASVLKGPLGNAPNGPVPPLVGASLPAATVSPKSTELSVFPDVMASSSHLPSNVKVTYETAKQILSNFNFVEAKSQFDDISKCLEKTEQTIENSLVIAGFQIGYALALQKTANADAQTLQQNFIHNALVSCNRISSYLQNNSNTPEKIEYCETLKKYHSLLKQFSKLVMDFDIRLEVLEETLAILAAGPNELPVTVEAEKPPISSHVIASVPAPGTASLSESPAKSAASTPPAAQHQYQSSPLTMTAAPKVTPPAAASASSDPVSPLVSANANEPPRILAVVSPKPTERSLSRNEMPLSSNFNLHVKVAFDYAQMMLFNYTFEEAKSKFDYIIKCLEKEDRTIENSLIIVGFQIGYALVLQKTANPDYTLEQNFINNALVSCNYISSHLQNNPNTPRKIEYYETLKKYYSLIEHFSKNVSPPSKTVAAPKVTPPAATTKTATIAVASHSQPPAQAAASQSTNLPSSAPGPTTVAPPSLPVTLEAAPLLPRAADAESVLPKASPPPTKVGSSSKPYDLEGEYRIAQNISSKSHNTAQDHFSEILTHIPRDKPTIKHLLIWAGCEIGLASALQGSETYKDCIAFIKSALGRCETILVRLKQESDINIFLQRTYYNELYSHYFSLKKIDSLDENQRALISQKISTCTEQIKALRSSPAPAEDDDFTIAQRYLNAGPYNDAIAIFSKIIARPSKPDPTIDDLLILAGSQLGLVLAKLLSVSCNYEFDLDLLNTAFETCDLLLVKPGSSEFLDPSKEVDYYNALIQNFERLEKRNKTLQVVDEKALLTPEQLTKIQNYILFCKERVELLKKSILPAAVIPPSEARPIAAPTYTPPPSTTHADVAPTPAKPAAAAPVNLEPPYLLLSHQDYQQAHNSFRRQSLFGRELLPKFFKIINELEKDKNPNVENLLILAGCRLGRDICIYRSYGSPYLDLSQALETCALLFGNPASSSNLHPAKEENYYIALLDYLKPLSKQEGLVEAQRQQIQEYITLCNNKIEALKDRSRSIAAPPSAEVKRSEAPKVANTPAAKPEQPAAAQPASPPSSAKVNAPKVTPPATALVPAPIVPPPAKPAATASHKLPQPPAPTRVSPSSNSPFDFKVKYESARQAYLTSEFATARSLFDEIIGHQREAQHTTNDLLIIAGSEIGSALLMEGNANELRAQGLLINALNSCDQIRTNLESMTIQEQIKHYNELREHYIDIAKKITGIPRAEIAKRVTICDNKLEALNAQQAPAAPPRAADAPRNVAQGPVGNSSITSFIFRATIAAMLAAMIGVVMYRRWAVKK